MAVRALVWTGWKPVCVQARAPIDLETDQIQSGLGYHQYANDISTGEYLYPGRCMHSLNPYAVHPGDTVSSTFTLSSTTAQSATWVSSWSINGAGSNSVTSVLTQTNSQNPFSSVSLHLLPSSHSPLDLSC